MIPAGHDDLTPAQRDALALLASRPDDWNGRPHTGTLYALQRRGLVEIRETNVTLARITALGLYVVRSAA